MKSTLAEAEAADVVAEVVEAVAHVEAEVAEEVAHVRVAGSLPPPLPPDQLRLARLPARALGQPVPARPLGQVLAALRLLLGLQVVLQQAPGPPVALQPGRLRKAALAQAALLYQGKVLPLHSGPAEQVPMLQAAVQRLAR